jgi:phage-related baseplate assembly protein
MIDLSKIPPPAVVESLDFETLLAERKARLLELTPEARRPALESVLALESEPIVILLQENAYRELLLRQRINDAARAVMLAYAAGDDLDQLAANCDLERFVINPGNPVAIPPVAPTMESDDDLRERVLLSPEGLSVAGPRQSYEHFARSADALVADVKVASPAPCEVLVTVLSREGDGTASADLLSAVEAALSADDVRPVGDRLTVQSAEIVTYTAAGTIYCGPGPEGEAILAAANVSFVAYKDEQQRLGRDVRRSAIFAALHVEGVTRVDLPEPAADVVIADHQVAVCTDYLFELGDGE